MANTISTFNQTNVELKFSLFNNVFSMFNTFNQTNVELKAIHNTTIYDCGLFLLFIKSKIQFFESKIGVAKADYNRRKTIKIYF